MNSKWSATSSIADLSSLQFYSGAGSSSILVERCIMAQSSSKYKLSWYPPPLRPIHWVIIRITEFARVKTVYGNVPRWKSYSIEKVSIGARTKSHYNQYLLRSLYLQLPSSVRVLGGLRNPRSRIVQFISWISDESLPAVCREARHSSSSGAAGSNSDPINCLRTVFQRIT